jgi:peptide/nickel transport system permease protein
MAVAELERESLSTVKEENMLTVVFRRFIKHKLAVAGMFVVITFVLAALFAPVIVPFDP